MVNLGDDEATRSGGEVDLQTKERRGKRDPMMTLMAAADGVDTMAAVGDNVVAVED